MNEDRRDNDVVDDRPYSRRWLMQGAAAFAVAGGIGTLGMVRWASARDDDDDSEDRPALDPDDTNDDEYGDDHGDDSDDDHEDDHEDDHDDHDDRDDKDDKDDSDEKDDDSVQSTGSSSADADENRVEIRDEQFMPATITIAVGDWVTWVNFDDDEHTATGENFDTGKLDTGARAEIQFNTPGSYIYTCQFHPEMHGEVIVTGDAAATPQASPEASPIASPQASPVAGGATVSVSIIDFAFEPQTLTVPVGTTVIWTNDGQAPHTVTSDTTSSGTLRPGDTLQLTFTGAQTFRYVCNFHPQMTGTIEVTG